LRAASILARHKSFCRAIKPRATKRSIAFWAAEARPLGAVVFFD
jgi:hypothetical protein